MRPLRPLTRLARKCTRAYAVQPDLPPAPASELPKPRLDYRAIAENAVYKSHNAFTRRAPLPAGAPQAVARLYESWKGLSHELNTRRHERGALGERIRAAARDPAAKAAALAEAQALKADVAALEAQVTEAEDSMLALALALPNDTHPAVPIGPEAAAAELSSHGPAPVPASSARDHVAVGKALGMLDLEAGATVTGTSWYYLLGDGALLELALTQYALAAALRHGFRPVLAPDVVRADVAARCGFQPRDPRADAPASQMYHVAGSAPELVLAGTAEIPLAGFFANKVLPAHELPTKLVGLGRAFRAEAGARGADTRGLYRVHQFSKLELFAVCAADGDASERMFEEMRAVQTEIFAGLGLSFRVLDMPTEELGASAYRKYDMEAWMPGRGGWGEISSASNCTDYQARRLHIRYRRPEPAPPADGGAVPAPAPGLPFAHTLNGTAAAIPRLIVALLENGARFAADGSVEGVDLPRALKPFWPGGADAATSTIRWI